ncbi:MAG: hypothetical protein AAFZ52_15455 [Bacteroidota bacterium]
MKKAYPGALLVAFLLLAGSTFLSAQLDCSYSDLSFSDPALYASADFTLSLTVSNATQKAGTHELVLYATAVAPTEKRVFLRREIALAAGENKQVELLLSAATLRELFPDTPDFLTFYLGSYEFGLDYVVD